MKLKRVLEFSIDKVEQLLITCLLNCMQVENDAVVALTVRQGCTSSTLLCFLEEFI
jgi:hypothetical protein